MGFAIIVNGLGPGQWLGRGVAMASLCHGTSLPNAWLRNGLAMIGLSYDSALDLQWLINAFATGGSAMAWYSGGHDMALALPVFVNGLAMA